MAKDIEKLIEEFVIPEMEYSPSYEKKAKGKGKSKDKIKTVTIDEIPEVVLPKTKAERYEEAKGRLKQKTSAVSRRAKKIEDQEVVATKTVTPQKQSVFMSESGIAPVADPVWVGGEDELVPYAWRLPLIADIARPNKYYRQAVREARELLLPVPQNKQ